jgi:protein SCO1/2
MTTSKVMTLGKALAAIRLVAGILLILGGSPSWAAPEGSPWGANYFPNVPLTTQDGKTVRFYDDLLKDKVVAINFIYTHCTDSCPAETANLRQVEKLLGDRMGKDIRFISISIDGQRDNPAALKAYAQKFNAGAGWTFATGKKDDVKLLRKKLGLYGDGEKLSGHSVNFMVGNERTGQWIRRSPFDEPKTLARLLGNRLPSVQMAVSGQRSYSQAPELPVMGKGETLYRSRCDSCHSLGSEDGIGPGLAGVTQSRDRTWLRRWIKEPDKMIEEKEPLATMLYAKYKQVAMPNLKLDDSEVEQIIGFLDRVNGLAQHQH